jgi:hypothetical protein
VALVVAAGELAHAVVVSAFPPARSFAAFAEEIRMQGSLMGESRCIHLG